MDDFVKSILQISKLQLSFLINQTTSLTLNDLDNSISEMISEKANHIMKTKPKYWEFLLSYELLKVILKDLVSKYKVLNSLKETKLASDISIMDLLVDDAISKTYKNFTNELTEKWLTAMGEPGKQGDAQLIIKSIFNIHGLCMQVINWETQLRSVYTHSYKVQERKEAYTGWTYVYITTIKDFYFKLKKYIESDFEGDLDIHTIMDSPDSVKEYIKKYNL